MVLSRERKNYFDVVWSNWSSLSIPCATMSALHTAAFSLRWTQQCHSGYYYSIDATESKSHNPHNLPYSRISTEIKPLTITQCNTTTHHCFLLAPTGALIVIMVYYNIIYNIFYISAAAAATFSDFLSVHWCNWCYKCHSKSLKQYQCNWCHKMLIGPLVHGSNVICHVKCQM